MTISETLVRPELREGAAWGLAVIAVVAAGVVASSAAGRRPRGWPVAGLASVLAALLALRYGAGVPALVPLGLGLLALGGLAPGWRRLPAVVPGALVLVSQVAAPLPRWAAPLVAAALVCVAVAGPELDARQAPGVGPAMMAIAGLGAWACVPDVEQVGGVAAAFAVVGAGSVWPGLRLGRAWVGPAAGLLLWAAAEGSGGRPASLVGAVAGLGLFVLVPPAVTGRFQGGLATAALVIGQAAFVTFTSRVAGMRTEVEEAAFLAAGGAVAAAAVVAVAARLRPSGQNGEPAPGAIAATHEVTATSG